MTSIGLRHKLDLKLGYPFSWNSFFMRKFLIQTIDSFNISSIIKDDFKGNVSLISWMLAPLGCFLCEKNANKNCRLDKLSQSHKESEAIFVCSYIPMCLNFHGFWFSSTRYYTDSSRHQCFEMIHNRHTIVSRIFKDREK